MVNKKTKILSVINQKGGNSKTTTVINLAAALSIFGKKVLIIDFDPQGNASSTLFGTKAIKAHEGIYNLLTGEIKGLDLNYKDFIKTYKGRNDDQEFEIDVLPTDTTLFKAEFELMSLTGREFFLRNQVISKIEADNEYDYVIIDSQPSLGVLVINVLCCSSENELIIAMRPDSFSREGIDTILNAIGSLKRSLGVMPKGYNILINQWVKTQISDRYNVNQIEKDLPDKCFKTEIRRDTKFGQAHDAKCDIFTYDNKTDGAVDYLRFAKELLGE